MRIICGYQSNLGKCNHPEAKENSHCLFSSWLKTRLKITYCPFSAEILLFNKKKDKEYKYSYSSSEYFASEDDGILYGRKEVDE